MWSRGCRRPEALWALGWTARVAGCGQARRQARRSRTDSAWVTVTALRKYAMVSIISSR